MYRLPWWGTHKRHAITTSNQPGTVLDGPHPLTPSFRLPNPPKTSLPTPSSYCPPGPGWILPCQRLHRPLQSLL